MIKANRQRLSFRLPRSADFQICCFAGFQPAELQLCQMRGQTAVTFLSSPTSQPSAPLPASPSLCRCPTNFYVFLSTPKELE
jgi:hypothetical protein